MGTAANGAIEVNVYYSSMFKDGKRIDRPIIEIRRMNSVQFLLQDAPDVIELLQEAVEHWKEEGEIKGDAISKRQPIRIKSSTYKKRSNL